MAGNICTIFFVEIFNFELKRRVKLEKNFEITEQWRKNDAT
jgi:hypothetical protein